MALTTTPTREIALRRSPQLRKSSASFHLRPSRPVALDGCRDPSVEAPLDGDLADRALDDVLVAVSHHSAVIGRLHEISTK
jgi:hypothetical protein